MSLHVLLTTPWRFMLMKICKSGVVYRSQSGQNLLATIVGKEASRKLVHIITIIGASVSEPPLVDSTDYVHHYCANVAGQPDRESSHSGSVSIFSLQRIRIEPVQRYTSSSC